MLRQADCFRGGGVELHYFLRITFDHGELCQPVRIAADEATAHPFLSITQPSSVSVTIRRHTRDDTGLKRRLGLESHIPWMIIDDFRNGARAKGIICGNEFAAVYVLLYITCSFFAQVRS